MPVSTRRKTPGRPLSPPARAEFNRLDLDRYCCRVQGVYYRVHGRNPATGRPYGPIHFSQRGASRFDPIRGPGTLCLGNLLAIALMEVFDDSWGAVGTTARALTRTQLREWWVTLVWLPEVRLLDGRGDNLSKLGTDLQLVTGRHSTARQWALRIARHPARLDGILYPSRHTTDGFNVALFKRPRFLPEVHDGGLTLPAPGLSYPANVDRLAYGAATLLGLHPDLLATLSALEVAILP